VLVHRLTDPRTAHPGHHHRHLVARNQRLHRHRDHQRPHRGLQPPRHTSQTRRLRVPKPRQLGPPDTIPLHPQTAGRNPDFMLIARSKSKSPYVHTTMLQGGRLHLTEVSVSAELASVGPMTLLPRVGKPSAKKVVRSSLPLAVLSDCVIGVRALNPKLRATVQRVLVDEFDDLASRYT